jgi:hypothetical protein
LESQHELWQTHKKYIRNEDKIEFLFMGDSHAARGVDTDLLPASMNIAYFGENCISTYYRLKYYLENVDNKPVCVIISGGFYRYSKLFCQTFKFNFFYQDFIDHRELYLLDEQNSEHLFRAGKYRVFPYLEWLESMKKQKAKQKKRSASWLNKSNEIRKQEAREFIRNTLFQNDPENVNCELGLIYLQKTIDLCNLHNVELIFLKYPVTDHFQEEMKAFREEFELDNIQSDSVIIRNNCDRWIYTDLFGNRHDYFIDSHHMNDSGRAAFSKVLAPRLDSILKVRNY